MNFSITSDFQYKKIPLRGGFSYRDHELDFLATNTETMDLIEIIESISPTLRKDIEDLNLENLLKFDFEKFLLALKKGELYFLLKTNETLMAIKSSIGKQSQDSIFLLELEANHISNYDKVKNIISEIEKLFGLEKLILMYCNSSSPSIDHSFVSSLLSVNSNFTKGEHHKLKTKELLLPEVEDLKNYRFYLYSDVNINPNTLVGKILGEKMQAELTLILAFAPKKAIGMIDIQMDLTDNSHLDAYIYVDDKPEMGIRGDLTFKYKQDEVFEFKIESRISPHEFVVAGSCVGNIEFEFLTITNLGIALGYSIEGSPILGLQGNLFFEGFNKQDFHTFIAMYFEGEKSMLSGAISDIGLNDFIYLFAKAELNMDLEILTLKSFSLPEVKANPDEKKEMMKRALNTKDLDTLHTLFLDYGIELPLVKSEKNIIQIRKDSHNEDLWYLTDNQNIRHYTVKQGVPNLEAQFYFASEPIDVWDYHMEPGIFVACEIMFFNVCFKNYIEVIPNKGIRILETMDEIDWGLLKISSAKIEKNQQQKIQPPNNLSTLLKGEKIGPIFYLCTFKGKEALFLSGHLQIKGLFSVDTLILYKDKNIVIDLKTSLFGINTHLAVSASYHSFNSGDFRLYFGLDFTQFNEAFNRISKNVASFFNSEADKIANARKRLQVAKHNIDDLDTKIRSKQQKIADVKHQIHKTPWRKAYKIPRYWGQIAVLEAEVLSLQGLKLLAQGALELANKILQGLEDVTRGVGDIIKKLASIVDWFLHFNHLNISIEMKNVGKLEFEVDLDFNFIGKNFTPKFQARLDVNNFFKSLTSELEDKITNLLKKGDHKMQSVALCSPMTSQENNHINIPYDFDVAIQKNDEHIANIQKHMDFINESNLKYIELYEHEEPGLHKHLNEIDKGIMNVANTHARISSYTENLKLHEALNTMLLIKKEEYDQNLISHEELSDATDHLLDLKDKHDELMEFTGSLTKKTIATMNTYEIRKHSEKHLHSIEEIRATGKPLEIKHHEKEALHMVEHMRISYEANFSKEEGILYEFSGDTAVEMSDQQGAKDFYLKSIDLYEKELEELNKKQEDSIHAEALITELNVYMESIKRVEEKLKNIE